MGKKTYLKAIANLLFVIILLILCITVLPRMIVFFLPFILGWIIACMAGPLVRFFEEKIRIRRKAGSAFVIISAIVLIVFLLYLLGDILISQLVKFSGSIPELWQSINAEFAYFGSSVQGILRIFPKDLRMIINTFFQQMETYISNWVSESGTPTFSAIGNVAKQLPTIIVCVIVCLLSAYFFVADKERIVAYYRQYCPSYLQYRMRLLNRSIKSAIGGYFKAQFKIEVWIYLLLVIGLMILKVEFAWLIAIGIAVLDFLPIFGTGTIMVPWAVIKFVGEDYKMAIGLLITWGIGQLVRQIIQPKIVGDSIGVPALPTLLMIYLGYRFGGVGGMIIAMPIGLIIINLFKEGAFATTVDSIRILSAGFNNFRKLRPEDLLVVEKYQKDLQETIKQLEDDNV